MTRAEILNCLTDRPCEVCKFHSDGHCSVWDCVFEEKPDDAEDCEDAISRAEVLKAFEELPHEYKTKEQRARTGGIAACQVIVSELPSVTPKQKMGRWIHTDECDEEWQYRCSKCNMPSRSNAHRYCSNCGTKMEVEE